MAFAPIIFWEDKELTIAQFPRVDGEEWPFTVRMTMHFANDKYNLSVKQAHHLQWLAAVCQQGDRIIESYGLADRLGEADYNMALSKRRLVTVIDRLTSFGVPRDKFPRELTRAVGENFSEWYGRKDGRPEAYDRAVVVFAWVNVQDFIGIGSTLPVCTYGRARGIPVL